jgi:isopentenyldiphosphate isomerase
MVRGEPIAQGDCHVVVHVCLINSRGEMLIQQRQPFKHGWPGMWDVSVGGSAIAGDTSPQAAQRELFEELGVALDFGGMRPQLTVNFEGCFDDYHVVEAEVEPESLTLQPEEVRQVKWASREEIFALIDAGEFIPYHKNLIALLFDVKGLLGAQTGRALG